MPRLRSLAFAWCAVLAIAAASCANDSALDFSSGDGGQDDGGKAGNGGGGSGGQGGVGMCPADPCEARAGAMRTSCPNGYVKGANGCDLCQCAPTACTDKECGGAITQSLQKCPDGSFQGPVCTRDPKTLKCGYAFPPCPPVCPQITCAAAVGVLPGDCPNGYATDDKGCPTCRCKMDPPKCPALGCDPKCDYGQKKDANGCVTCQCNPPPACQPKECGPAPGIPSEKCWDGSVAGPVCQRDAGTLKCGWVITKCPPQKCQPLACPYAGPGITRCPDGYAKDANGCDTCECAPPPMCKPVLCRIACPYGFQKDANGCEICACAPPPACTKEDCANLGVPLIKCAPGYHATDLKCARTDAGTCGWSIMCVQDPPPLPAAPCGQYSDTASCQKDEKCRWLRPGCTDPKLPVAGCYTKADIDCALKDAACTGGRQCLKRTIDPCPPGAVCFVCSAPITVCL